MQILTMKSDELLNSFQIMLEEAGSRPSANDAVAVIAGFLQEISEESKEIENLSKTWSELSRYCFDEVKQ